MTNTRHNPSKPGLKSAIIFSGFCGGKLFHIIFALFSSICTGGFAASAATALEALPGTAPCAAETCTAGPRTPRRLPQLHLVQARATRLADGPLGSWRLVRTPGPEKDGDIISIMHTADVLRSDPEFAGVVIRCRPKSVLQIALVVITPFRPRSHPALAVSLDHLTMRFKGEVIPPGSMVALPDGAEVLTKGQLQAASHLIVDIEGDGAKIHGVVQLDGISSAIAALQSHCITR